MNQIPAVLEVNYAYLAFHPSYFAVLRNRGFIELNPNTTIASARYLQLIRDAAKEFDISERGDKFPRLGITRSFTKYPGRICMYH